MIPHSGLLICILGLMMVLRGIKEATRWGDENTFFFNIPFDRLGLVRSMICGGFGFVLMGVMLMSLP